MAVLLFIVFGFVVGLFARGITPGADRIGLLMTDILGVVGSFAGVLLTNLMTDHRAIDFHAAGLLGNAIGALAVLFIASGLFRLRSLASRARAPLGHLSEAR
jgi:uncharacterized membrane protein YeaQ/YmgE (transglycosylase-associated protein family)